jgi:NAD(P)-dependent dehydrogenase (short-subunit alcohol dehydrogenase family)
VVGITRSAASELAALGIRVNAVAPGSTVTPMTSALIDEEPEAATRAITHAIAQASPLGFACMPDDIANAILFALSEDSRYMTGHTLVIDAGQTTGGAAPPFFSEEAAVLLHAGQRTADV